MDSSASRDSLLQLTPAKLLSQCQLQGFQGSGPGGQHRNKTQTGVRLFLASHAIEVKVCEERSALRNRELAVERLRLRLALLVRCIPPEKPLIAFPGSGGRVNCKNPGFAPFVADVLDRLEIVHGQHQEVARQWGLSVSALVRIFFSQKELLETVQNIRTRYGLGPLRSGHG